MVNMSDKVLLKGAKKVSIYQLFQGVHVNFRDIYVSIWIRAVIPRKVPSWDYTRQRNKLEKSICKRLCWSARDLIFVAGVSTA